MAWITSATSGKTVPKGQLQSLQAVLLTAHLALLLAMLFDRQSTNNTDTSGPTLASLSVEFTGGPMNSAPLALVSGLLLGLIMLAANRPVGRGHRTIAPSHATAACTVSPAGRLTYPNAQDSHDGLLARLNHDLRTPLNAIIGFADLMKAEAFGPLGNDRYRAYAAHMQTCGHDLLRATESTLAMASLLANPTGDRGEVIDLGDLAAEAWRAATPANTGTVANLALALDPEIHIRGNLPALRQSLVGLLGLACERSSTDSRIEFGARRSHGRVQAWISVTGGQPSSLPPRTGCRSRNAATGVDELAIGVSRTLLGVYGIPLVETCNRPGAWIITMSLEDAAQADFFEPPAAGSPAAVTKPASAAGTARPAGYFGVMPVSASRSA